MTNWDERKLNTDLSFLSPGKTYQADIYTDGEDANKTATSYIYKTITVTNKTKINLPLAKGGGAVISLSEMKK